MNFMSGRKVKRIVNNKVNPIEERLKNIECKLGMTKTAGGCECVVLKNRDGSSGWFIRPEKVLEGDWDKYIPSSCPNHTGTVKAKDLEREIDSMIAEAIDATPIPFDLPLKRRVAKLVGWEEPVVLTVEWVMEALEKYCRIRELGWVVEGYQWFPFKDYKKNDTCHYKVSIGHPYHLYSSFSVCGDTQLQAICLAIVKHAMQKM